MAPAHTNPVRATWRPARPLMFGDSKRPLGAVALPGHPALTVPRSPRRLSTGPISATRATAQPPGTHGRTTAYAPKAPRGVGSYTACVTTCVLFASSPCACHQPPRAQWTQRRLSRELCGACCARPGAHDCTLCVATPRLGHQLDVWTTAADSRATAQLHSSRAWWLSARRLCMGRLHSVQHPLRCARADAVEPLACPGLCVAPVGKPGRGCVVGSPTQLHCIVHRTLATW
jgi:hypothetical protein